MNETRQLALRVREVADQLGISRSKTYTLIASGELPSIKIGASLRVPTKQLEEWLDNQADYRPSPLRASGGGQA